MTETIDEARELPQGWLLLDLEKTIYKFSTNEKKIKQKDYLGKGLIPVIDQGQEFIGGFTDDENKIVDCELPVVVFGDHTKVVKFINFKFAPGADGVKVIKPFKAFHPKLFTLFLTFLSKKILDKGYARHFQHLEKERIPVPPWAEQERIFGKVEELFSDIDQGIESLKTAQKQLKVYRQAVLKWAFEGKLTEEWRKQQSTLKTGEALLAQIKAERENRYQQQLAEWATTIEMWEAIGKVGKKPTKPQKLQDPSLLTVTQIVVLFELPLEWCYVRAEAISEFITKGTTPSKEELFSGLGDVPFIKVYNLTDSGLLDFTVNPTFVSAETHKGFLSRSKVLPNDVLMNIVGPPLGKVSLVFNTFNEWNINQAIVRYRPLSMLMSKYLMYYLLSQVTINRMSKKAKATAGQFNLTLEICRDIEIPICSQEEQEEIVQEIESRLSICDQLEATITENLQKAEALRQSILKQAFEGKLVPQDPNDEPAEKLLERIQAERQEKQQPQTLKQLKIKGV